MKPEYQQGGAKRGEILAKAVQYLRDTKLRTPQADRQHFLLNVIGLSVSIKDRTSGLTLSRVVDDATLLSQ